jgi:hypothetical protein
MSLYWGNFSNNSMQHILNKYIFLLLIFGLSNQASAQLQGEMQLLADTVALGNPAQVKGWVKYNRNQKVVFPDTSQAFKPYEYIRKELSSFTVGSNQVDSFIYEFRSFEIAPKQILSLTFLLLSKQDTLKTLILKDSFKLISRLPENKDSLTVIAHEDLLTVNAPPDYSGWLLLILIGILMLGLAAYFAYKPILKYLAKRKIYIEFNQMRKKIESLSPDSQEEFIYSLNHLFRSYYSSNLPIQLGSLSTPELKKIQFPHQLASEDLQFLLKISIMADSIIYAGQKNITFQGEELKKNALQLLLRKKNQLIEEIRI